MSVIDDEDRIWRARCAAAPDGWPFDADREDPLTALRIPVTSFVPRWCYLASFDQESSCRPTDTETAVLASYIGYLRSQFTERYQRHMASRPLDVESGGNTTTFHKYGEGDWGYRKQTWRSGCLFFPGWPNWRAENPDDRYSVGPFTLPVLLDHIETCGGVIEAPWWQEWKAAHPEVFSR